MMEPFDILAGMLGFYTLGWQELIVILLIVLLLFGGRKLPELARGLAKGLRSFRDEFHGVKKDLEGEADPNEKSADAQSPADSEDDSDAKS